MALPEVKAVLGLLYILKLTKAIKETQVHQALLVWLDRPALKEVLAQRSILRLTRVTRGIWARRETKAQQVPLEVLAHKVRKVLRLTLRRTIKRQISLPSQVPPAQQAIRGQQVPKGLLHCP